MQQSLLDLKAATNKIHKIAFSILKQLQDIPNETRGVVNDLLGIKVFVAIPGTLQFIDLTVCDSTDMGTYLSSEKANLSGYFAHEKAARSNTLGQFSSQNSACPEKMQFAGSVTMKLADGSLLQVSVSGAQEPEDVACSVAILACLTNSSTQEVCENIRANDGMLPEVFFEQEHYLQKILFN